MSDKLPWFPFYLNDWETDTRVRVMGPVARSYYLTLLMIQWREGVLPESRKTLQRLLVLPSDPVVTPKQDSLPTPYQSHKETLDYDAILDQVLECFESDGQGGLINSTLNDIRNEQLRIVEAKSKGGKKGIKILERVLQESSKSDGVDLDLNKERKEEQPSLISDLKPCEAARLYLESEEVSIPVSKFNLLDVEAGIRAIQLERKLETLPALEWLLGQAKKAKSAGKKVGPDWVRKAGYNDLVPKKPIPMVNAWELKQAEIARGND